MTNLEILQRLKEHTFIDEYGESYQLEFRAGLSDFKLEKLQSEFPNKTIADELIWVIKNKKKGFLSRFFRQK